MYGYVYLTTNVLNGKKYIGQHKSSYHDTSYLGSGTHIIRSINAHGKSNFTNIILEKCDSKEKLDEAEKKWISKCDAVKSNEYYNLATDANPPHDADSLLLAKLHRSSNNTEKYGDPVGYWHTYDSFRKRDNTKLKNYGHVEGPLNTESSRLKAQETMVQRYGVRYPVEMKSVKDKSLQTRLDKYHSYMPPQAHSSESNLKRSSTLIKRYGSINPFSRDDKDTYLERMYTTNLERYGNKYGRLHDADTRAKATKNAGKSKSCRYLYKGREIVGQDTLLRVLRDDGYHIGMTKLKSIIYDHIPSKKYPNLSTDIVVTFRYIPPRVKSKKS